MKRPKFSLRTLVLFVCLAAAAFGLWYRWEPWVKLNDPELLRSLKYPKKEPTWTSPGGKRCTIGGIQGVIVFETSLEKPFSMEPMAVLDTNEKMHGLFIDDDTIGAYFHPGYWDLDSPDPNCTKALYRRRRPEYWYGCAWLPEFWLTLLFGIGLAWSVRRDWKRFRPEPKQDTHS